LKELILRIWWDGKEKPSVETPVGDFFGLNLGDYVIARGSDLPLQALEIEVLPPVDAKEEPKGMAEVSMIPVVAP